MKIIIKVDEKFSKKGAIQYLDCINIDDELIKSIKVEK